MTDDDQEQENIRGWLQGTTTLGLHARGRVTAVAERLIALHPLEPPKPNLRADLKSLFDQSEGRKTETLKIIIDDPDSTFEQFDFDKGNLTDTQARILFIQIVIRREIKEEHKRELEKIQLKTILGLFGKWLSKLFGAS